MKEIVILLVHDEQIQNEENIWYLDNGDNNHMCRDKTSLWSLMNQLMIMLPLCIIKAAIKEKQ